MTAVSIPASAMPAAASESGARTGWQVALGLPVAQVLLVALLRFIGPGLAPVSGIIAVSVACLISLSVAHVVFMRRDVPYRFFIVILLSFVVRVLIGVGHFVTYINPDYVMRPYDTNYEWDYEWLNQEMARVAETWNIDGFLAPMDPIFYVTNKNAFITIYNGALYWATGVNVLTYAPWNAVHSAYLACIIVALARRLNPTSRTLPWIAVLIAFQPFGLISSIFWRDTVGQSWLAFGFLLMLLARRSLLGLAIATPIAAFMAFSVREPYLLLTLVLAVFLLAKQRLSWQLMALSSGALVLTTLLAQFVLALAFRRADRAASEISAMSLPFRAVRAVLGPFPWYQVTYSRELVPGAPYMIPDFLQHVVSLAVYALVIPVVYATWRKTREVDAAFFFGALLFLTGLFAPGVHSSYVTIGTAFMLPMLVHVPPERVRPMLVRVFLAFVGLNVFWWASGLGAGASATG